jgi:hypothetical protein
MTRLHDDSAVRSSLSTLALRQPRDCVGKETCDALTMA